MKNQFIYILSAVILFSSCEKVIDFEGEVKESKIVINSLFNTEDTFSVHISNSLSLIDVEDLKYLKNADLKLYDEAGSLVSTPQFTKNGFYVDPDFKFSEGKSYKIVVEKTGYKTVEATDIIPKAISINKVDSQIVMSQDGYEELQFAIDFNDPEGENYYMVEVSANYVYRWDTFEYSGYEQAYLNTIDPNVSGSGGVNGTTYGQQLILSDRNFDGKTYTFRFNTSMYILDEYYENVEIKFYSISKAVYNYFTSLQRYQNVQGDPFATPVQVYSNVENGFGIFGGAAIFNYKLK